MECEAVHCANSISDDAMIDYSAHVLLMLKHKFSCRICNTHVTPQPRKIVIYGRPIKVCNACYLSFNQYKDRLSNSQWVGRRVYSHFEN